MAYKALESKEQAVAKKWLQLCHIERSAIHGGSFTGNAAKLLLSKLDVLESICKPDHHLILQTLKDFSAVVDACFSLHLNVSFSSAISKFRQSYLNSGRNITPKVHVVFHHIEDFCNSQKLGLGLFSEQASEAVHYSFSQTWPG